MSLEIPTVHLNGTSKKELLGAIEEAYSAINDAIAKLAQTSPNGRDYYPQGPEAIYTAQLEHAARVQADKQVIKDLETLSEEIS